MLELSYSNRPAQLAQRLLERLQRARPSSGLLFCATRVVTPDETTSKYLQLQTAEVLGDISCVHFQTFDALLADLAQAQGARLLHGENLLHRLLKALLDPAFLRRVPQLEKKLEEAQPQNTGALQLAESLVPLFEAGEPQEEGWQRALWKHLRSSGDLTLGELRPALDATELHLFGVLPQNAQYAALFGRLASNRTLYVYAQSPCAEFWDDLQGELKAGPALLSRWGRPGRAAFARLGALSDWSHETLYTDELPKGALGAVQASLLNAAEPPSAREDSRASRSPLNLEVLACDSIRGEARATAERIIDWVSQDSLRYSDIAVLLPTRHTERYRAHFRAALLSRGIPHHSIGAPESGPLKEALDLLLSLPGSDLTRKGLERVLLHPNVRARVGEYSPERWAQWIDSLHIIQGADLQDLSHTYLEKDRYSWEQGCRRLALGAFMQDTDSVEFHAQEYLPQEYSVQDQSSAGRLIKLVRALISDARFAQQMRPLRDQLRLIRAMLSSYIAPRSAMEQDTLHRFTRALLDVEQRASDQPASFELAVALVKRALGALRRDDGEALVEGVCLLPLDRAAQLPFSACVICGPERAGPDREQDRYRLLELLSQTERRLAISYIRSTGESAALQHLLEAFEFIRVQDAVRGASIPEGIDALRGDLITHLGGAEHLPGLRALLDAKAQDRTIFKRLRVPPRPVPSARRNLRLQLPIAALHRFLLDPMLSWCRYVLSIKDTAPPEHDEFSGPSDSSRALRRLFLEAVRQPNLDLEASYQKQAHRLELQGHLPSGVFGEAERERHLRTLKAWHLQLQRLGAHELPIAPMRFGRAHDRAPPRSVAPAVLLNITHQGQSLQVELHGATEPLLVGPAGSTSLSLSLKEPLKGASAQALELRGFLDHVLLASQSQEHSAHRAAVLFRQETPWVVRFKPIDPEDAKAYLSKLVESLLFEAHDYLLPFWTTLAIHKAQGAPKEAIAKTLASARRPSQGSLASLPLKPPSIARALEYYAARYAPYFHARLETAHDQRLSQTPAAKPVETPPTRGHRGFGRYGQNLRARAYRR